MKRAEEFLQLKLWRERRWLFWGTLALAFLALPTVYVVFLLSDGELPQDDDRVAAPTAVAPESTGSAKATVPIEFGPPLRPSSGISSEDKEPPDAEPTGDSAAAETAPASPPGAELFACTSVPGFVIDISAEGLESLRQQPRESVKATLRYGGEVFPDVAVHIKGSQGSVQSIDERPALTVSFNKFFPKRRFHGLRKIHFNNEAEDPTFLTDVLCAELFRDAGVPAARAGYATLQLNGRPLGLYVLKEGLTREFLAQYFTETGGNLYDGGFQMDVNRSLELLQGPGPEGQPKLRALVAAAREPDLSERWGRLAGVLDTERFARSLAMQTLTWNWDGYAMARNNYRVYHDPATDRLVFIPHGLDQMFWEPQGPIYPRMRGLVAAAFVGTTEGDRLYRDRLTELHTKLFQVDRLARRVKTLAALIKPFRPDVEAQAERLNGLIAGRIESVAEQLRESGPPLGR